MLVRHDLESLRLLLERKRRLRSPSSLSKGSSPGPRWFRHARPERRKNLLRRCSRQDRQGHSRHIQIFSAWRPLRALRETIRSEDPLAKTAKHAKVGVGMSETQESDYRGADLLADAVMPAQGEREIFVCLLSAQRVAAGLPVKRSISCNSSVLNAHSTAATFCATWSALVAPAMTLATAGCAANQENASSTRP